MLWWLKFVNMSGAYAMPYAHMIADGGAKGGIPCSERPSFAVRKAAFRAVFCHVLWRPLYIVDFQQVALYLIVVIDCSVISCPHEATQLLI